MRRRLNLTQTEAEALLAAGLFAIQSAKLDVGSDLAQVLAAVLKVAQHLGLDVGDLGLVMSEMPERTVV